jgi:hypothetical protein
LGYALHSTENFVAHWLFLKGYETRVVAETPDTVEIEAFGDVAKLLIKVHSASYPEIPAALSSEEESEIIARAKRLSYVPWEAKVQIDDEFQVVRKIEWRLLLQ